MRRKLIELTALGAGIALATVVFADASWAQGAPQTAPQAAQGRQQMANSSPAAKGGLLEPGRPVAYQDARRGYMLIAPPGSRVQERDNGQVAIQSRTGYAVNIQTGDANPSVPLTSMFAKLEQQYLGDGRAWSRKVSDDAVVIAGLPARVAVYEGSSTRTRVIIARGQKTDFVLMFFAPVTLFEKLSAEFSMILASFRPGPDDVPAATSTASAPAKEEAPQTPLRAKETASADPAGRPRQLAAAPAHPALNVFSESGYGYRLEYPVDWVLEKSSAFMNVFSGKEGTPAYEAIVTVQNVQPSDAKSGGEAAETVYAGLKSELSGQAKGVDFVGEKQITYSKRGLTLTGRQFVANYDHQGRRFRKWALVLPRPDGSVAHIWSYTAPMERFDAYRPVAEGILNSFLIEGGRG